MDKPFVIANIQLFLERFAYYAARVGFVLVLFSSVEYGGLGLTTSNRAMFFDVLAILTVFMPIVMGRLSDAIGPRKAMITALGLDLLGFVLLCLTPGLSSGHFVLAMVSCVCLGLGSALFFPTTYGRIVQNLTQKNVSLGLGFALMSINLGAFFGPLSTDSAIWGKWLSIPLYIAVGVAFLNLLITAFAVKSRAQTEASATAAQNEKKSSILRLLFIFLCILGLFAFAEIQFGAHETDLYKALSDSTYLESSTKLFLLGTLGIVGPLCILPLAWASSKFKRKNALLCGMGAICFGGLMTGLGVNIVTSLLGLLLLTFGGFLFSIKWYEYVAMNAPANRKATYMGFARIPSAFAYLLGLIPVYEMLTGEYSVAFWGVCLMVGILSMVIVAIFLKKHPLEDGV